MIFYGNALNAIRAATAKAPRCVGYRKGAGWFTYDPAKGCPSGDEPEFFVARQGILPLPLSNTAIEVWTSIVLNALRISEGAKSR